jgi:hypothetical protein
MKKLLLFSLSIILAGIFTGCQQQNTPLDEGITIAEDEVGFIIREDALDSEIVASTYGGHMAPLTKSNLVRFFPHVGFPACAEVTVSGTDFPKEITIDFGDECLTRNGKLRSGIIYITISDQMTNAGAEYSVIYEDVVFGNRAIEKAATYTNEGQNEDGNWVVSHQMECTVTYGDTLSVTRNFAGEKEWIDGFLTPEFADNKFYRTGGGTITVNDDIVFEREIIDPLYIDRACRFILGGVVEITRNGELMTIDFGDGLTCDNIAVVTKDGVSEEIELSTGKFRNRFERFRKNFQKRNGWW